MRTTLTLDEDVAAKLKEEVRRRGLPFKQVVNRTLRAGLNTSRGQKPSKKFRVRARALGARAGVDFDNVGELLERIEGPLHR